MKTREAWLLAYRNARLTAQIDTDRRFTDPRFDAAIQHAFYAADHFRARLPGRFLGMLNHKRSVLAGGGYWPGFLRPVYNCRCTPVPVSEAL